MKILFQLLFIFSFTQIWSADKADSTDNRLKATASFTLNSNGISSIPFFSLDKPALVSSVSLSKGRLLYEPQLAYSLDFKPWYIDNWFHFKIIDRPRFEFRTGMNLSTFFSKYKTPDEEILQAQKYFDIEVAGIYKFSAKQSLTALYWNDRGLDRGTVQGHFYDIIYDLNEIRAGKHLLLAANLHLFYIDYNGNNDGMFFSPKITASIMKIPFAAFFQATQPLTSNISPYPPFKWNVGLTYFL